MKNSMLILIAVFGLLFVSCEKEDSLFAEFNPVKIENFKINGEQYADSNELLAANFTMSIGDGVRLEYFLEDDRKIKIHSLYFLVNDDYSQRRQIFLDEDVDSEWLQVEQYFRLANLLRLESDEIYLPAVGDQLYFYLTVEDKWENESAMKFIVDII